jgi:tyrosyl-tRNA synthetase
MQKESIKRRINSEEGISYTEFSYMLCQAYDYLVLYDKYNCTLQIGGSDQWGNITAGCDLIRKKRGGVAHGIVFPLVTNSDGSKFGKSESGTIWLDGDLTSPYQFYQWALNTDDRDVVQYLKYFTWLDEIAITDLAREVETAPEKRTAQRTLAREITGIVHGKEAIVSAEAASRVLFGGSLEGLSLKQVMDIFQDVPTAEIPRAKFSGEGMPVLDLLADSTVVKSKGEAKRMLQAGGLYLNNRRLADMNENIRLAEAIEESILVLRKGKKEYLLVKLV